VLRRLDEALPLLDEQRRQCDAVGHSYNIAGSDPFVGLGKIFQGKIAQGIKFIEKAIEKRDQEGFRVAADWYRGTLT
jgi:hypothetical protein